MYFSFTINYPVPNLKFMASLPVSIAPSIMPENTHHAAVEYYHPDFGSHLILGRSPPWTINENALGTSGIMAEI